MGLNPFSEDREGIQVSIRQKELRRACILAGERRNRRADNIAESGQKVVEVDMENVGEIEDVSDAQKEAWANTIEGLIYDELKQ